MGKQKYYIYIIGYSSALKMKEILTYTTMWMNLEKILLSQSQKDKYSMILLT